jgi:hypothetical protein
MKSPKRSRTIGPADAHKAGASAVDAAADPTHGDPTQAPLHSPPARAHGVPAHVATLSPTEAAAVLGVGRTKAYHLLKDLTRVAWSSAKRPRYRRDHVLRLLGPPSGEPVLAIDAGRKVAAGFEHLTVEEFDKATAEANRVRRRAHLDDPDD